MAPDRAIMIDLVEEAGDWGAIDPAGRLPAIAAALSARLPEVAGTLTLVLADDAFVRGLNGRFRNQDKPTNVLSFPSGDPDPDAKAGAYLGDVILAAGTLRAEAARDGKAPGDHFNHLTIHGILHLLGYDHISDSEAQHMERLEIDILADLGIDDPYRPAGEAATAPSATARPPLACLKP